MRPTTAFAEAKAHTPKTPPAVRLAAFAGTMTSIRQDRADPAEMAKVLGSENYAAMVVVLWKAALKHDNSNDPDSTKLLQCAATEMNVGWKELSAHLSATPAANLTEFVPSVVGAALMGADNSEKSNFVPGVKEGLPRATKVYNKLFGLIGPREDQWTGDQEALHRLGDRIRGWGKSKATDVQLRVRELKELLEPTGLNIKDLKQLPETTRGLVLSQLTRVFETSLDADQLMDDVRQHNSSKPWQERLQTWTSNRAFNVAGLLDGIATTLELDRDPESYRDARVAVGLGAGITNASLVYKAYGGVESIMYFPSAREREEGRQARRMVAGAVFGAVGGVVGAAKANTSRGDIGGLNPGFLMASYAKFAYEVGVNIPGLGGVAIGRDKDFGPYVWLNRNPTLPGLGWLAKIGVPIPVAVANVRIFHAAFGPAVGATKKLAEGAAHGLNAAKQAGTTSWRWLRRKQDVEGREAGWPTGALWEEYKGIADKAQGALEHVDVALAALRAVEPRDLVAAAGPATAEMLGDDAKDSEGAHATLMAFLEETRGNLDDGLSAIHAMARCRLDGTKFERKHLKQALSCADRHTNAVAWVGNPELGILGAVLAGLAQNAKLAEPGPREAA